MSSGSVGVVLDLNQFVIGFVSAGGLCRLGIFLGWLGLGTGFRGLCGGGRPSTCVSIRVHGCALCEPSAAVLTGLVCVGGWFLCFFSGGRIGDVASVSLSRVRVCGLFVWFRALFRDVTADPHLISLRFVPHVSAHGMRCAGCVSAYRFSLSHPQPEPSHDG